MFTAPLLLCQGKACGYSKAMDYVIPKAFTSPCITNAYDHERHGRRGVRGRDFANCQCGHVRENGHARAHGCGQSRHAHAGDCAGADVRGSCSWYLQCLEVACRTFSESITLECRSPILLKGGAEGILR